MLDERLFLDFCEEAERCSAISDSSALLDKAQSYSFRRNLSIWIFKNHLKRDFRSVIRRMILEDKRRRLADEPYYGDTFNLNSYLYLLTIYKDINDVPFIWDVKSYDWDFMMAVDVQLLVFCGVDDTLSFLKSQKTEKTAEACDWIVRCNLAGDFEGLSSYFDITKREFDDASYVPETEDDPDIN